MLNLYSDPEGKRIFENSNPVTAHRPTSSAGILTQSGSDGETAIGNAEEVLKEKDKRISELERELTLIKVRKNYKATQTAFNPLKWSSTVFRGLE